VFPSSGEDRKTPNLLDRLDRANVSHKQNPRLKARLFLKAYNAYIWNCRPDNGGQISSRRLKTAPSTQIKSEECRLLGYKTPVCTSQETHNVSGTEFKRLMLYKI
jgi:hypothetical protein